MARTSFIILIALCFFSSLAVMAYGLSEIDTVSALFRHMTLKAFGQLLVGCLAVSAFVLIAFRLELSPIYAGVALALLGSLLTGSIWALLTTIWITLSCYAVGQLILTKAEPNSSRAQPLAAILIGAVLYGTLIGLIAHLPINYPGVYALAFAAPVFLLRRSVAAALNSFSSLIRSKSQHPLLDSAIVIIGLMLFGISLMPEVGFDALAVHLFIPGYMDAQHIWHFDASQYAWAVMPMLGDWLYAGGYLLAGEQAARFINLSFIFISARLLSDLVLWAHGNPIAARFAVLLFLSTPLTLTESSSLFIESVWGALIIGASLSLFRITTDDKDKSQNFMITSILLAGALASKAVTLTFLPALFLVVIWRHQAFISRTMVKNIVAGIAVLTALGSIPYLTAFILTGNPVFPFYNHIFNSPYYPAVDFSTGVIFGTGLDWDAIYSVTFNTERFIEGRPGTAGFQWLLLPTALLIFLVTKNLRAIAMFAVSAAAIAFTFEGSAYLRYIYPAMGCLTSIVAVAIWSDWTSFQPLRNAFVYAGFAVVLLNLIFFRSGSFFTSEFSLEPLLSDSGRQAYLAKKQPIRNLVEVHNKLTTGQQPLVFLSPPLAGGLQSDALYPNWYNVDFQTAVNSVITDTDMINLLDRHGADFLIFDQNWGSAEQRLIVEKISTEIVAQQSFSLRKIKAFNRFEYREELLKNPDFFGLDGWINPSGLQQTSANEVSVSVNTALLQTVSVTEGRRYLNTVTAKCGDQPAQGRLQVTWVDSLGEFLNVDIDVFDCAVDEKNFVSDVSAPDRAAAAHVYASAHTETPVTITRVSFK